MTMQLRQHPLQTVPLKNYQSALSKSEYSHFALAQYRATRIHSFLLASTYDEGGRKKKKQEEERETKKQETRKDKVAIAILLTSYDSLSLEVHHQRIMTHMRTPGMLTIVT